MVKIASSKKSIRMNDGKAVKGNTPRYYGDNKAKMKGVGKRSDNQPKTFKA